MERYFVTVRHRHTGNRMELDFRAEGFGHAEEQAEPYVNEPDWEIISIEKDYTNN